MLIVRGLNLWKGFVLFMVMSMNYQSISEAAVPVRVWGDLTAVYRERDFNAASANSTDWLSIATINASSYIWQPWFALVDGSLSMTTDNRKNSSEVTVDNKYASGKFRLNLFPVSRFPFILYTEKSSNDRYDNLLERNIINTVFGVRQQYTSMDGKQFFSGNIERNKREDIDQESFVNDMVILKARYKMENNSFYGNVDYSGVEKPNRDDAINYAITGRHAYVDSANLNIENMLSTSQTHNDFITNSNDTSNNQISSFLSWRPGNKSDLNITGSLRASELSQTYQQYNANLITNEVKQNESSSLNVNQGLIYNYTPQIIFTESLNGVTRRSENNSQFIGSESLGANYSSESKELSAGYYNWYTGINVNRQHGDDIITEKFIKNQLGHSLSRDIFLTDNIKFRSSFNQSVAYEIKTNKENSSYLNHSITMNWSESSYKKNSSARFVFTDIRNDTIEKNNFQLFNMQFLHDYRISRHAHFIADLTLQRSYVTTDRKTTVTKYRNGQVNYINSRFLNIPGLSYKSELRISNKASNDDDVGVENYVSYRDNLWRNEVVYSIGLFESRMSLDYVKNGDDYDRVIKIQLTRSFGDI